MSRVAESIPGEEGGVGGVRGGEEVGRQEAGRGGLRRRRAGRGMETMHYYRVYCTLKRKLSCKKYEFILWQHNYKDLVHCTGSLVFPDHVSNSRQVYGKPDSTFLHLGWTSLEILQRKQASFDSCQF